MRICFEVPQSVKIKSFLNKEAEKQDINESAAIW